MIIALLAVVIGQTISNSIGSSSNSSVEPALYDEYSEEYDNRSGELSSREQRVEQNKKPTSSSPLPQTQTNSEEDPLILNAGLSQVYSKHNANPNRDAKSMKLLLEMTGDADQVPMNCSQYKVSV